MPEADETPRVRGAVFLDQLGVLQDIFGGDVVERALQRLTPAQREEVQGTLAISWIGVRTVQILKDSVAEEVGWDSLVLQREVVRRAIDRTLTTFWKATLRHLWDGAIARSTPLLYSRSFDRGAARLERLEAGKALFMISGWRDMPEYDCVGLAAGIDAILECAGRTDVRTSFRKQNEMVWFEATWTPGVLSEPPPKE